MKWEPSDVIRLVALIGGLLLILLGALMMWQGIAADGQIDIKASFLTGHVKTGSAGLLIAFLGFTVVAFAIAAFRHRIADQPASPAPRQGKSKSQQIRGLLLVLVLGVVGSTIAATLGYSGFVGLALFFGFLIVPVGVAYFAFLEEDDT